MPEEEKKQNAPDSNTPIPNTKDADSQEEPSPYVTVKKPGTGAQSTFGAKTQTPREKLGEFEREKGTTTESPRDELLKLVSEPIEYGQPSSLRQKPADEEDIPAFGNVSGPEREYVNEKELASELEKSDIRTGGKKRNSLSHNLSSILKPLRTYKDDIAEIVNRQKTSLSSMVIAEQKKRDGKRVKKKYPLNPKKETPSAPIALKENSKILSKLPGMMLKWLVVLVLLVAGAALFYFAYLNYDKLLPVPEPAQFESLISVENQVRVDVTGMNKRRTMDTLAEHVSAIVANSGVLTHFYIVSDESGSEDVTMPRVEAVAAGRFLDLLEVRAPSALLRSLSPEFMMGAHGGADRSPFLILTTDFYEGAFAKMLEWEEHMNSDLAPLFGPRISSQKEVVITTDAGTSTILVNLDQTFKDRVVQNRDTRVLTRDSGNVTLIYGFINRNTILITTNEETFDVVARRISAVRIE